jgi:biotin carboxyl carrier protein
LDPFRVEPGVWSVLLDGVQHQVFVEKNADAFLVTMRGRTQRISLPDPRAIGESNGDRMGATTAKIATPMPGKVVRLLASLGDIVEAGAGVVVVEAMKMQNELKSPIRGKILMMAIREGAAVDANQTLVVLEAVGIGDAG